MNFLAHLHLARGDEDLMLGALLGDFVRGRRELWAYPAGIRNGIRMHRRIDKLTDRSSEVKALLKLFDKPFRRYAGIIVDLAFDHELARKWSDYSSETLPEFDLQVREVLARHAAQVPDDLKRFMAYADQRGLFASYREEEEIFLSLAGIGTRLKRANPLHQVREIWPEIKAPVAQAFDSFYPQIQSKVSFLRNLKSTTTGS